ncbi:hypothetical protein FE257_006243 [Aspergillus nanangensis]|uniref:Serine hydrolase domain-containing protein n=1 Tax=Aspergillus nanangensis TaxID=2582783 RepID=A0AAD4GUT5_ASPNN|nr:hypothetical protein FE257_006243 [Aspergillus nanangensis]
MEEDRLTLIDHHNITETQATASLDTLASGLSPAQLRQSLDTVFRALEEDGEITTIMGFSEGASMASSVLLEEIRFGAPPLEIVRDRVQVTQGSLIDVPSLHVLSPMDPFRLGAAGLLRVFELEKAVVFCHGTGHLVPRDAGSLEDLKGRIVAFLHS